MSTPDPSCRRCQGTGAISVRKDPDELDDCPCVGRVVYRIVWAANAGRLGGHVADRTPLFASFTAAEAVRRGLRSPDLLEVVEVAA